MFFFSILSSLVKTSSFFFRSAEGVLFVIHGILRYRCLAITWRSATGRKKTEAEAGSRLALSFSLFLSTDRLRDIDVFFVLHVPYL